MSAQKKPKKRSNATGPAPIPELKPQLLVDGGDPAPYLRKGTNTSALLRYPELRHLFLQHLARYGNATAAAAHIRMSLEMIEQFRKAYPWFQAQMDQAHACHKALIEKTIHERAIDGWLEPRFGKFGVMGHVRRFSDTLLVAYARRHIKDYREGDVTQTNVSGTVDHRHSVDLNQLTPEQREALRLLLGEREEEKEVVKQITVEVKPATNGHVPGTNGVSKNGKHE